MERRAQHATTSDGVSIAYQALGRSRHAVLLIPCLGRSGRDFDALGRSLADAGFLAIAIDLRGVGESSGPLEGLTLHDIARDVLAVADTLGGSPVHVVGHAFGNRVARCFAADYPGRVRSVTLLAAGGLMPLDEEAGEALRRCFRDDLPQDERLAAIATAFFSKPADASLWLDGWWPEAAAAQGAATRATPVEDWWTAGRAPLLVIQGLDDRVAVPENGRALRDTLGERVRLVELPDAGHALLPEQPDAIARALIAFLREH